MTQTLLERAAGGPRASLAKRLPAAPTSCKSRFGIELHSDFGDAEFRSTWKSLEESANATAFQRLSYIETIISHIAPHQAATPILIGVREMSSGAIVLVAAMMRYRRLGANVVTALDHGLCDYFAPLIRPGYEMNAAEFGEIWREICRALKPVDAITIQKIPGEIFGHPNPMAQLASPRLTDSYATTLQLRSADGARLASFQNYSLFKKT